MIDWKQFAAYVINTIIVVYATQGLTYIWPILKERYGWLVALMTPVLSAAIASLGTWLSAYLGYPIDLSALLAIISGTSAVWGYQVFHQLKPEKRGLVPGK